MPQYRVYVLEGLNDLAPLLRPGQDHLPRHKDQQHHSGLHHSVDQAWEQLWLIAEDGREGKGGGRNRDGGVVAWMQRVDRQVHLMI